MNRHHISFLSFESCKLTAYDLSRFMWNWNPTHEVNTLVLIHLGLWCILLHCICAQTCVLVILIHRIMLHIHLYRIYIKTYLQTWIWGLLHKHTLDLINGFPANLVTPTNVYTCICRCIINVMNHLHIDLWNENILAVYQPTLNKNINAELCQSDYNRAGYLKTYTCNQYIS